MKAKLTPLFLILIFAFSPCSSQTKLTPTQELVNSYNDSGFLLRNDNPTLSYSYLSKALKRSVEIGYKYGEATALKHLGFYHRYQWHLKAAIDTTVLALKEFIELENISEQLACRYNLSQSLSYNGEKKAALDTIIRGLRQAEEAKDYKWIILHNVQIGNIYASVTETERAKEFLNKALDVATKHRPQDSFRCYQSFGEIAEEKGNWEEALHYYYAGLSYAEKQESKHYILLIANRLNIAQVLCKLGYYDSCIRHIDVTKRVIEERPDFDGYGTWADFLLANAYLGKRDFKTTLKYGIQCLRSDKNMGPKGYTDHIKQTLASGYYLLGYGDSAYIYQKEYTIYRDSVNDIPAVKKWFNATLNATIEYEKELSRKKSTFLFLAIGILLLIILLTIIIYRRGRRVTKLLENILPASVVDEYKSTKNVKPREYNLVTVLFTDFVGFTETSARMDAEELLTTLNEYFVKFDAITSKYGIEKIKTIGDAYMAVGGLPVPNADNPEMVVQAGLEILEVVKKTNAERKSGNKKYFEIRIGIHSGKVIAGKIGETKFAYDIWGADVNIASRVESNGLVNKVNISEATYKLVKDKFNCIYRDDVYLKGVGKAPMYYIE